MSEPLNHCLTIPGLAKRWRCRRETIRAMIKRGELAAFRLGTGKRSGVRISPEAVRATEAGPAKPAPRRRTKRAAEVDFF
jgi:excisionase family DNA binding protein